MSFPTSPRSISSHVRDRIGSIVETVDPYLLNPITVAVALHRGRYVHRFGDVNATFETTNVLETASLFHTFRKEAVVFQDVLETLESDDVFYDVGANIGAFTCFAGRVITDGKLLAFEPHPGNVDRLERNIKLNGIDVAVYGLALSNESGTAELSVDLGWVSNQRYALSTGGDRRTISVETAAGDDLVDRGEIPSPTVVKIDVEGAERQVIEGLESALEHETCRIVYCEIHPDLVEEYGEGPETVRQRLRRAGFELDVIHSSRNESYLKGTRS